MSQMQEKTRRPYEIVAHEIEDRYARGWHCLGLAVDYGEEPQVLNYFGTKLVAYRGADDQVHILDAYCPHMGADLSQGCVEGNSIRCPFHGWRWGADGICDEIPYARRIPPKAAIRSWPTMEENKLLFIWNDPEGNPPIEEQRIPRIANCFSDEWSDWFIELMTIKTNCRELVDNMADAGHFAPVHGAPVSGFQNIMDQHTFTQVLEGTSENLAGEQKLTSVATYFGPAYMNTYMQGSFNGTEVHSRLLVTHVPVDTETFDLRFGVMVKKAPGLSEEQVNDLVNGYVEANRTAFFQDVDIWHTKTRVDNPLLCDGDGPIKLLREWYDQFYRDIAEVPARFKERRVMDVLPLEDPDNIPLP